MIQRLVRDSKEVRAPVLRRQTLMRLLWQLRCSRQAPQSSAMQHTHKHITEDQPEDPEEDSLSRCNRPMTRNQQDACAWPTATEKAALAAEAAPAETLAEAPAAAASALAFEAARPAPISADRACDLPAAPPAFKTETLKGIILSIYGCQLHCAIQAGQVSHICFFLEPHAPGADVLLLSL